MQDYCNKLTSVQRMQVTEGRIKNNDILDSIFTQDMDIIRRTMEETSHENFYNAVGAICQSRKIYILGARSSLALATFLHYYLGLLFDHVVLVQCTSEAEIFEQMIRVNEQDVVIGISFPRYSRKAVKAMNFAHNQGAKVVAITDSTLSPLQRSPIIFFWPEAILHLLWILSVLPQPYQRSDRGYRVPPPEGSGRNFYPPGKHMG